MSRCPIIALTGVSLFILAPYLLHKRRNASSKAVHGKYSNDIKYSKSNIHELISSMEVLIQADEGGRGINEIMPPAGELYNSALEIMSAKNVAIITGFPCMIDYDPPTETDGPLGALAIAKCLLMLGKDVVLATDECNEEVLLACAAASAAHKSSLSSVVRTGILTMESFPAQISFTPKEDQRLQELAQSVDLVIAIERAGPCKDGRYLTMRARDMSNIVAPLDLLIMPPGLRDGEDDADAPVEPKNWGKPPRSIGIGGNILSTKFLML